MTKIYLSFLLLLCLSQANAQEPSAISDKVLEEKVIGRSWSATDTVILAVQGFHITKDSIFRSSQNFAYRFIQVKDNIFELALFIDGKNAGYLYGYISWPDKLSILLEEERQKISTGLPTGGDWETYAQDE